MAEPLSTDAIELRLQLTATLYEIVTGESWDAVTETDRTETGSIIDGLVPVFADWVTSTANQELLIAHQRTETGCSCGWADLGEYHAAHVLAMLAKPLGSLS